MIGIYLLGSWYSLTVGPWSVRYNGGKPSRSLRKYPSILAKITNQEQHPGVVAETSVILTDLKEAGVVIPFMSLRNSPVVGPAETRLILNYDCRLLQAQLSSSPSQSTATVLDVVPKTDYCGLRNMA